MKELVHKIWRSVFSAKLNIFENILTVGPSFPVEMQFQTKGTTTSIEEYAPPISCQRWYQFETWVGLAP